MESTAHRPAWKTLLAFAIIYFVWGSTFLAIRIGVQEVPPFLYAAMRFFTAGLALYLWVVAQGERSPSARQWLSASLLEDNMQDHLANALFASSRHSRLELHFNKGLAGAPPDAIAAAQGTAMNPAVLTAFALAIAANGQEPAYPGISGHEPSIAEGQKAAERTNRCMNELRAVAGESGSYVSESNYFERRWQESYWGSNYPRLASIKRKYDPDGLFIVHNGVGSEQWSADGFTKL